MNFANEAQQALYQQLHGWLTDRFGKKVMVDDDEPLMGVRNGSAVVRVHAMALGDAAACTRVFSLVVTDVEPSLDLYRWLLEQNGAMPHVRFWLDDGAVCLGSTLPAVADREEFEGHMNQVAERADHFDDLIVSRWGGLREKDRS